jgi:hypothetical protein
MARLRLPQPVGVVESDEAAVMNVELTAWLTFDFTDELWSGLVRVSGDLPQNVRAEFKDCVRQYLYRRARHFEHEIEYRDRRKRLHKKILAVLKDSEWKGAIASIEGLDMALPGKPPIGRLTDRSLTLIAKRLECRNLQVSQNSSRPGPKSSQPSYQFIADAAALLEKHTQPATRSDKKGKSNFRTFIQKLCAIADPAITSGTIDEALKKYITRRRQNAVVRITPRLSEPPQ